MARMGEILAMGHGHLAFRIDRLHRENDKSYQEVVTADYMMVSPIMDEILRSNTGLTSEDSHLEYRPGKNQGQIVENESVKSEFFQDIGLKVDQWGNYIDYPHAGILSSLAFLSRYPTTETIAIELVQDGLIIISSDWILKNQPHELLILWHLPIQTTQQ